mgnify:CR=1 FL=1
MANEGKVVINNNGIETVREQNAQEQLEQNASVEKSLETLRQRRNALLEETDWIVTKAKETGTTIPTAWKTYRQALRDITENLTTVEEVNAVVFPTKP